jgi:phosphoadenosine phosphosulfate reductase
MDDGFAAGRVAELTARYGHLSGEALLKPLIEHEFAGSIVVVSSFGAEAAVLLALVAAIDPATPVLFLDTGKHFPETLRYRDRLVSMLALKDVRSLAPDAASLSQRDPDGTLWQSDPDACCHLRKTAPLAAALAPFAAWISGRKRFHGGARAALGPIEAEDRRIKINPLAAWTAADIAAEFKARALLRHPLVADGYLSIGCMPCTAPTADPEAPRSGRWAELAKTECGIHQSLTSSCL